MIKIIPKKELDLFYNTFKEEIENFYDEKEEIKIYLQLIDEIYNSESNYNNADKTSNMICYRKEDIEKYLIELNKSFGNDNSRCKLCLKKIYPKEYLYKKQKGFIVEEEHICVGYDCDNCRTKYFYE